MVIPRYSQPGLFLPKRIGTIRKVCDVRVSMTDGRVRIIVNHLGGIRNCQIEERISRFPFVFDQCAEGVRRKGPGQPFRVGVQTVTLSRLPWVRNKGGFIAYEKVARRIAARTMRPKMAPERAFRCLLHVRWSASQPRVGQSAEPSISIRVCPHARELLTSERGNSNLRVS